MKIVHIITRLILGGAQENTLLTVEGLRAKGDDVTLITGPPLGPEGSLMERTRAAGLDVRVLAQLRRAVHPWRDWCSYRALVRTLRELRPDIVHTHSAKAGLLGRKAAAKIGVPVVVHTIHGSFHAYRRPWMNRMVIAAERRAAKHTTVFISVADAMTQQAVAAGVAPADRFTTIYSGMEVEPFIAAERLRESVRSAMGYGPEHAVIGKVARLFDLKGHEYVIEAAREVVRRHRNARFLFVGDGILRERLRQQIQCAGLDGHFHFTGLVAPTDIPGLLAAMDVVVHCSLREGLARVLPQALIVGRPVVSYDVDGAREVVLPGRTGFLLPPRSVGPLAAAMCTLIEDKEMRRRYGEQGRALFTDQFRHEVMVKQIRALYVKCLTGLSHDAKVS